MSPLRGRSFRVDLLQYLQALQERMHEDDWIGPELFAPNIYHNIGAVS